MHFYIKNHITALDIKCNQSIFFQKFFSLFPNAENTAIDLKRKEKFLYETGFEMLESRK